MNTTLISETAQSVQVKTDFPIWKTIKLGTALKTDDDFRQALKQSGMRISDRNKIFGKRASFTAIDTEMEVNLVLVSCAELGFKYGATHKNIYESASDLGLDMCPAEVGPQLRLQYIDQPRGESLSIAMEPIIAIDSHPYLFYLFQGEDRKLWLGCKRGDPNFSSSDENDWILHRWIFMRRK